MDISGLKINSAAVERGAWISNIPDMGDLAIKTRGLGNADWTKLSSALWAAVPRGERDSPEAVRRINVACLLEAGLQDWNLTAGGVSLPYSRTEAERLLNDPDFRPFYHAALYAAGRVQDEKVEETQDTAKN